MRVTQRMLTDRVLRDLNQQTLELLRLQEQLSSGRRINAPSDDPVDIRRALNVRTTIQKDEQYINNVAMTRPQHRETEEIISTVLETVRRAHELTIQGANGTNSPQQLSHIAEEINQLLEGVLNNANHRTGPRYIFGGTNTLTPPFLATRNMNNEIIAVTYQGNSENIQLAVSDTVRVTINEPGDQVFQSTTDIFQTLIDIRDNLRLADQNSLRTARLPELESAREQLLRAVARGGGAQNQIDRTEGEKEDFILQNQVLLSQLQDADYAETILNFNQQQNAYQAALQAAARVLQPSLLDFVR